jgi:hypothetical protein
VQRALTAEDVSNAMTRPMRTVWMVLAVIVVAATGTLEAQATKDAEVYAVVVGLSYHMTPGSRLAAQDVAIPMPAIPPGALPQWLAQFDEVPSALRRAASQPEPTKAAPLDAALFPAGTRMVSRQDVQALFKAGVEDGWTTFRRQYGTEGFMAVSQVLYTADALDAIVYYTVACGGLCGEGGYLWLHRGTIGSPWVVAKKIISMMA